MIVGLTPLSPALRFVTEPRRPAFDERRTTRIPPRCVLDEGHGYGILDRIAALAKAPVERLDDSVSELSAAAVESVNRKVADPSDEEVQQQFVIVEEMLVQDGHDPGSPFDEALNELAGTDRHAIRTPWHDGSNQARPRRTGDLA